MLRWLLRRTTTWTERLQSAQRSTASSTRLRNVHTFLLAQNLSLLHAYELRSSPRAETCRRQTAARFSAMRYSLDERVGALNQ